MRAALRDATVVNHQNAVRILDGVQAMGDYEQGFARAQLVYRLLDGALVVGIDAGGGLVEDDDGRVLQDAARDGDALALAS